MFPSISLWQAKGTDHPALYHTKVHTGAPYWIHMPPADLRPGGPPLQLGFRYQHSHALSQCSVKWQPDCHLDVTLEKPERAVAPGQYAVFYDGEVCLGSAKILSSMSILQHEGREPIRSAEEVT